KLPGHQGSLATAQKSRREGGGGGRYDGGKEGYRCGVGLGDHPQRECEAGGLFNVKVVFHGSHVMSASSSLALSCTLLSSTLREGALRL
ncbi:hypothetical protein KUCAC02_030909, partial [Chaenocephalus aceratus]